MLNHSEIEVLWKRNKIASFIFSLTVYALTNYINTPNIQVKNTMDLKLTFGRLV